jgi:hypothetical protein
LDDILEKCKSGEINKGMSEYEINILSSLRYDKNEIKNLTSELNKKNEIIKRFKSQQKDSVTSLFNKKKNIVTNNDRSSSSNNIELTSYTNPMTSNTNISPSISNNDNYSDKNIDRNKDKDSDSDNDSDNDNKIYLSNSHNSSMDNNKNQVIDSDKFPPIQSILQQEQSIIERESSIFRPSTGGAMKDSWNEDARFSSINEDSRESNVIRSSTFNRQVDSDDEF